PVLRGPEVTISDGPEWLGMPSTAHDRSHDAHVREDRAGAPSGRILPVFPSPAVGRHGAGRRGAIAGRTPDGAV
ncbi:MAG: hypothetical protein OXI83_02590, partial [Gemmatimonadota bacterium]|nr:hypothetical protein [Gemmatimonadota bacterium]